MMICEYTWHGAGPNENEAMDSFEIWIRNIEVAKSLLYFVFCFALLFMYYLLLPQH